MSLRRAIIKPFCKFAKSVHVRLLSRGNLRKTAGLALALLLLLCVLAQLAQFDGPARPAVGELPVHAAAPPTDALQVNLSQESSVRLPGAASTRVAASVAAHDDAPALPAGSKVWIWCAGEGKECQCAGRVRWGVGSAWRIIDLTQGEAEQKVDCSLKALKDPAPGASGKHCQCESEVGSAFLESVSPGLLPSGARQARANKLVASCDIFEASSTTGPEGEAYWRALEPLCSATWASRDDSPPAGKQALELHVLRGIVRAWVDWQFVQRYDHYYGDAGWVERAFVNYYAGKKHSAMVEELIKSVHLFSSAPIVVVHFGVQRPGEWTPERFPQLVLLHAPPMPPTTGRSFNFNKLRAMLLARVRIGVELDADQFVAPGVDAIFARTEQEVTRDYPIPILPAHFLNKPWKAGKYMERFCPEESCEFQTLRWGHAHPTWTFWAAPWIAKWLRRNLRDETLRPRKGGRMASLRVKRAALEDEDLLNIATWEDGGTKQWCKFDVPNPDDFEALMDTEPGNVECTHWRCSDVPRDTRWHPVGVPRVFFTAHDAKDAKRSRELVEKLKLWRDKFGEETPPNILYRKHFYKDGAELKAANPEIRCII